MNDKVITKQTLRSADASQEDGLIVFKNVMRAIMLATFYSNNI
jgi:hypothetical protein